MPGSSAPLPKSNEHQTLTALIGALDLNRPGLATIDAQIATGAMRQAAASFLRYAKTRALEPSLRPAHWGARDLHLRRAQLALSDRFELQDVSHQQPRRPDGGLDWRHRGPNGDPEWSWFLNRHGHFHSLLVAWEHEHDARYLAIIEEQLVDWIHSHPWPGRFSLSAAWRPLEAARRVVYAWLDLCFPSGGDPLLSDDALELLWKSIGEHGELLRHHHTAKGNHLLTEMRALATIALAWPEFSKAPGWLDYAVRTFEEQLHIQTYPDGAQTELSNHYQRITALEAQQLWDLLAAFDLKQRAPKLGERLTLMWDYFASTMRPDGQGPLNNDGSLDQSLTNLRTLRGSTCSDRVRFIRSFGAEGEAPAPVASRYFAWAGQAITRDDWTNPHGRWARFDLGPHGTDHQHADYLNIELTAGRRTLLADPGRFTYKPGAHRDYFAGPAGHNVVRIDGQGTTEPPDKVAHPLPAIAEFAADTQCFAGRAAFPGNSVTGTPGVPWTRVLFYRPGEYWLVIDHIALNRSATVSAGWHFGPTCTVRTNGSSAMTDDTGKSNLLIKPAVPADWRLTLLRGQEHPEPRGWYSRNYNGIEPCTVADYQGPGSGPLTFAWLLLSLDPGAAPGAAEIEQGVQLRCGCTRGDNRIWAELRDLPGVDGTDRYTFALDSGQLRTSTEWIPPHGQLKPAGGGWEALRLG